MLGLAEEKSLVQSADYSLLEMEREHSETFQDSWLMSEYLLVVNPDKPVYNKVVEVKQEFDKQYNEKKAMRTLPSISIAAFMAREPMENTFIRWIQRICGQQESFQVTLNNFSGFPPHSIYLRVQDPFPFQQLVRQLQSVDDFIRSGGCPPAKFFVRPYLSIAAKLPEQVYESAIPDYSRLSFHESFIADELVLLKRQQEFDSYQILFVFRFFPKDRKSLQS